MSKTYKYQLSQDEFDKLDGMDKVYYEPIEIDVPVYLDSPYHRKIITVYRLKDI